MALRSLAVDFNSFFASCEMQERPELRGKPVGIVPVLAETTCCLAASDAAKARGVKVGPGVAEARALCPEFFTRVIALALGFQRCILPSRTPTLRHPAL